MYNCKLSNENSMKKCFVILILPLLCGFFPGQEIDFNYKAQLLKSGKYAVEVTVVSPQESYNYFLFAKQPSNKVKPLRKAEKQTSAMFIFNKIPSGSYYIGVSDSEGNCRFKPIMLE